ncbi:Immunity protein Imm6 [Lachnospiraceae bacterium XPB1003]|nr:Immunity protein Imm6 [Lachnospiraceae bacterium XPB1003]
MADQTELQNIRHCIEIIDNIKGQICDEEAVRCIEEAVDFSWQWLNDKTDVSQKLYDLLDNEEYSLTIYQESENDEHVIEVWNCIIDSIAYICRKAYEYQGAKYYPEPIELVDEDTYSRLLNEYEKCMK